MFTAAQRRQAILENLAQQRVLVKQGYGYTWADGLRSPSLRGDDLSALYRADYVEDGLYDPQGPMYGKNLDGTVVLTVSGRLAYQRGV